MFVQVNAGGVLRRGGVRGKGGGVRRRREGEPGGLIGDHDHRLWSGIC